VINWTGKPAWDVEEGDVLYPDLVVTKVHRGLSCKVQLTLDDSSFLRELWGFEIVAVVV
jgi:hypothetical protein